MISNGFDTAKVLTALTGRIGWRQPNYAGPSYDITQTREDKYYIVGSGIPHSPVQDDTVLNDPDLKGYDYTVEIRGTGTVMQDGSEIRINPNGGFSLTQAGNKFYTDQVIIIHFKPSMVVVASGAGTGPVIDADNLVSKSGRYFQDFHSAVTVSNVYDLMEQVAANDIDFNAYLDSLQQSVIMQSLNAVFIKPQLVETNLVFERGQYYPHVVANMGKFVGFQIRVAPGDYSLQLLNVMLNFNQNVSFTLYLFNEGRLAPLWTQQVTAIANDETIVSLNECIFRHASSQSKGGLFYFGYYQNDIGTAQAIEENFFKWNEGKIYEAFSFEAQASGLDFDKVHMYSNYRDYGLNLELSVFRDYTKLIIQNSYLFDELIGLHMAAKVIEGIIFSDRSNKTQRISKDNSGQLYTDLNLTMPTEESPFSPGLKTRIIRELNKVHDNFFPDEKIQTTVPCL